MENANIKLQDDGLLCITLDPTVTLGEAPKMSKIAQAHWVPFRLPDGREYKLNLFLGRIRTSEEEEAYRASPAYRESGKKPKREILNIR